MTIKSIGHTPGPWVIGYGGQEGDGYAVITSPHCRRAICNIDPLDYVQANADFIVRACNSHEDLLVACEMVIHNTLKPEIWLQFVADAIAKAKG